MPDSRFEDHASRSPTSPPSVTLITSADNPSITEIRKLAGRRWRDKLARFVAEGEDLVAAAEAAGWPTVGLFHSGDADGPGEAVHPALLDKVSTLGSGTRVLGVYEQRWAPEPSAPCVYLHGIADPGNVGTVLRAAYAFGAGCVALGPGSADPFGPKAVRASMGAIFAVPVVRVRDATALPAPRVGLDARGEAPLAQAAAGAGTLLVGAEREGLPAALLARCEQTARIPIAGAESLNAAMAATIALYELRREGANLG